MKNGGIYDFKDRNLFNFLIKNISHKDKSFSLRSFSLLGNSLLGSSFLCFLCGLGLLGCLLSSLLGGSWSWSSNWCNWGSNNWCLLDWFLGSLLDCLSDLLWSSSLLDSLCDFFNSCWFCSSYRKRLSSWWFMRNFCQKWNFMQFN